MLPTLARQCPLAQLSKSDLPKNRKEGAQQWDAKAHNYGVNASMCIVHKSFHLTKFLELLESFKLTCSSQRMVPLTKKITGIHLVTKGTSGALIFIILHFSSRPARFEVMPRTIWG